MTDTPTPSVDLECDLEGELAALYREHGEEPRDWPPHERRRVAGIYDALRGIEQRRDRG